MTKGNDNRTFNVALVDLVIKVNKHDFIYQILAEINGSSGEKFFNIFEFV